MAVPVCGFDVVWCGGHADALELALVFDSGMAKQPALPCDRALYLIGHTILFPPDGIPKHRTDPSASRPSMPVCLPIVDKLPTGSFHDGVGDRVKGDKAAENLACKPIPRNRCRTFRGGIRLFFRARVCLASGRVTRWRTRSTRAVGDCRVRDTGSSGHAVWTAVCRSFRPGHIVLSVSPGGA